MISRAFIFLFIIFSVANASFVNEEECLNYTVYPVQYELTIVPYISDFSSFFDCHLSINVIANEPGVRVIELDAKNMDIDFGSIHVMKGNVDIVSKSRPYEYDNLNGKLYIHLSEPLIPYNLNTQGYNIKLTYRKVLTEKSDGIFLVKYADENGENKYLFTTRLTPNKAKYFFPCFDNPRFEAVFKFRVYVVAKNHVGQYTNTSIVIGNEQRKEVNPQKDVIIDYTPSPQVTTDQVGFHYSRFTNIQITSKNDIFMVWAPGNTLQYYNFILVYGKTILDLIHEYSGVNRPLVNGPIHLIAVPSERVDGYEIYSWNLLTNRANRIAHQEEFTSIKQLETMTFDLAQQFSRIWLGNPGELQRTRWREEWFKEGVATYLAYYFLAQYNQGVNKPSRRQPLGPYGLEMKFKAMAVDSHRTTPPLGNFNKSLAAEIPLRYRDLITMKTASILWMVENWIGSDKFHQALVKYINSRRGKYISLEDFTAAMDRDTIECMHQFFNGSTTSKILHSWIHQSGYPVINVQVLRDRTPNAIQLNQRRFSFSPDNRHETDYLIPISYIVQNNENCYNCYKPRFTIGSQTYTFGENLNGGWIVLNRNASGYYRVNYDTTTWQLIASTLAVHHESIDELNRAQIVNDVFALYVSGDMELPLAMEILNYLDKERSPVVWRAAEEGFRLLRNEENGCHMTRYLYKELQDFMRRKVAPTYDSLSNSHDFKTRLFRSDVVNFACSLKYKPCLDNLKYMYEQYRRSNMRLDPDFREACYYMLIHDNAYFGINRLNAFEQDDRRVAEHRLRDENRFIMKTPVGVPRPMPIIMSTEATTLEASPVITEKYLADSSTSIIPSISIILVSILFAMR
ncbi:aminopeptidase N [Amyelois transitella]|uniref:aminopeptidase N n=1 Tax=Amyelois transitella TaxID=680683 RepID=UPI00298FDFDC|nr:aminopeptidase N [Amyelois transitella]